MSAFAAPDLLLMVLDATALERDLEFALELMHLGKPMEKNTALCFDIPDSGHQCPPPETGMIYE